ncbi:MAG: aminotransferase class V-fold PLP-dependent enzyme [Mesorhizobium sp.]
MSQSAGRNYLAIPGPSVVPDRVLLAMHRASPNIYEGPIVDMAESVKRDLRRFAATRHDIAVYISNGHGAWEAATSNLFSRGDRALVLVTGQFGAFWADAMRRQGVNVDVIDFGRSAPADPARVADALAADAAQEIRAVCLTHVDTSTSIRSDILAIRKAIEAAGHPALLVVDAIASLGSDELLMDDWGVDVLIGASQKGAMLPPGLGFVWFSGKARAASDKADLATPYWDWKPRADGEFYLRFGGTPPTQLLFGLRESLTMILEEEGLAEAWKRHAALARTVWAAFDAWSAGGDIGLNVPDPAARAHAVTTARIAGGQATALRNWLEANTGVTLSFGLGMAAPGSAAADDYLRMAHMGHVNGHMTLGVLAAMEAGMQALGIPHGRGAVEAAAQTFANAWKQGHTEEAHARQAFAQAR